MTGENIKPLPATHNGIRLRSWTEKRVCVALDAMGVRYAYEPEGFRLESGVCYRPDFLIPDWDVWLEVKREGWMNDNDEAAEIDRKAKELCEGSGKAVLVTDGALRAEMQGRCWFHSCSELGKPSDAPDGSVAEGRVKVSSSRFLFTGEPRPSRGSGIRILLEQVLNSPKTVPLKRNASGAYRRYNVPFVDLCDRATLNYGTCPAFVKAAVGSAVAAGLDCRYEIGSVQQDKPVTPPAHGPMDALFSILSSFENLNGNLWRGDLSISQIELILAHCNGRNRPFRKQALERLESAMERDGAYRDMVSTPFYFYADGNLADGQHRLRAALNKNRPLRDVKIVTGCTEEDMQAFNSCAPQSDKDYMTVKYGISSNKLEMAAARGCILYSKGEFNAEELWKKIMDRQELYAFCSDNQKGVCAVAKLAGAVAKTAGGSTTAWGGLGMVCYMHDSPERAQDFLRGCARDEDADGNPLSMDDPRRTLKKFALSKRSQKPRTWAVELAKAFVCSYEAFRNGEKMKRIKPLADASIEFTFAPVGSPAPAEAKTEADAGARRRPARRVVPRPLVGRTRPAQAAEPAPAPCIAPGPEVYEVVRSGDAKIKIDYIGSNGEDAILAVIPCVSDRTGRIEILQVLDFEGAYCRASMVERTRRIWTAWAGTEMPRSRAEAANRIGELVVPERLQCVYNDRRMWNLFLTA